MVFEDGVEPVWVESVMPFCDGVILVKEGMERLDEDTTKAWWGKGVNVDVWLRSDVMDRLVVDKSLRAFA